MESARRRRLDVVCIGCGVVPLTKNSGQQPQLTLLSLSVSHRYKSVRYSRRYNSLWFASSRSHLQMATNMILHVICAVTFLSASLALPLEPAHLVALLASQPAKAQIYVQEKEAPLPNQESPIPEQQIPVQIQPETRPVEGNQQVVQPIPAAAVEAEAQNEPQELPVAQVQERLALDAEPQPQEAIQNGAQLVQEVPLAVQNEAQNEAKNDAQNEAQSSQVPQEQELIPEIQGGAQGPSDLAASPDAAPSNPEEPSSDLDTANTYWGGYGGYGGWGGYSGWRQPYYGYGGGYGGGYGNGWGWGGGYRRHGWGRGYGGYGGYWG